MLRIREYTGDDTRQVGKLIADTYAEFNLPETTPEKRTAMLGPFAFVHSSVVEHQEALASAISAPSVWIAEHNGEIVGVLRGGRTDNRGRTVLSSLFVAGRHHRRGIGRALVERFEQEYAASGVDVFKVAATEYAVPFYLNMGYKRSTNVRSMRSFREPGLPYQPMKKTLK
jgi:GNAT superfamily N-acetyltransferase